MIKTTKDRMRELKALAAKLNCSVTDNRDATTIEVEANDGWSWDDGSRSCQWTAYGSSRSYLPAWRQEAIAEAIERLKDDPPINQPYIGDE